MRIALDFDGVLHSYAQGFTGATDLPGAPVAGAHEFIRAALAAGHELIVYSCRARTVAQAAEIEPDAHWGPGGREAMREWLERHDFPALEVTGTKPSAAVYIDDRALTFRGTWPSLDKLARFRPWEQRNGLANFVGTHARPEEILTPGKVTDCVREIFGGPIRLDPCAARDDRETVQATVRWYGTHRNSRDGLEGGWLDYTFANPPYGKLHVWLSKGLSEAERGIKLVILAPVRSRRTWWRVARSSALAKGAYVELNDLTFVGYESNYPESLCLLVFNLPVDRVKASVSSRGIGEVL